MMASSRDQHPLDRTPSIVTERANLEQAAEQINNPNREQEPDIEMVVFPVEGETEENREENHETVVTENQPPENEPTGDLVFYGPEPAPEPAPFKFTIELRMQALGTLVGMLYSIPFVINLSEYQSGRIAAVPILNPTGASQALAMDLPLSFYYFEGPLLITGFFSASFSALGASILHFWYGLKTFPYKDLTKEALKKYFLNTSIRNVGHVLGAAFGLGLATTYLICNMDDPKCNYFFLFNSHAGVPKPLVIMTTYLAIPGICSNLLAYGSRGTNDIVRQRRILPSRMIEICKLIHHYMCREPTSNDNPNLVGEESRRRPKFPIVISGHSVMLFIGAGVGIAFAANIIGDLNKHYVIFPTTSNALSLCLPLNFYEFLGALFIVGLNANFYAAIGTTWDIIYKFAKAFSNVVDWKSFFAFLRQVDTGNVAHVIFTGYGIGMAATYLYFSLTDPQATFVLPFGAHLDVPINLLRTAMFLYVTGAMSAYGTYAASGTRYILKEALVATQNVINYSRKAWNWFQTVRGKNNPEDENPQPQPAENAAPTQNTSYIRRACNYFGFFGRSTPAAATEPTPPPPTLR